MRAEVSMNVSITSHSKTICPTVQMRARFIYPLFLGRSAVICIRIALQYLTIDPCERPVRDYLRDLLRFRPGSWLDLIKPYGREGTSECTRVECTEEQQDKY